MKELMPGIRVVQCTYDIFPVPLIYDIFAVRRHGSFSLLDTAPEECYHLLIRTSI
jgi:hypothetical protein